ncbi:copper homeostasis protein cutC [Boeremia exigua]|uniref:copper homeostasis protein cutC n=1 Tax=Boeremia exigua TaxID=749465 RepID=UPI001E8D4C00|nr:copper homeostasis protein cutC [Boeremia exigua]KAH6643924.1 copper homeostasis protein cutC [Boeremia exigua]
MCNPSVRRTILTTSTTPPPHHRTTGRAMLEVAVFSAASALTAIRAGAHRIELCASYASGGLTPSLATFLEIIAALGYPVNLPVPIHIMIRPHAHSFVYTPAELAQMTSSIAAFAAAGASGFVFGALDAGSRVDVAANAALVRAAGGRPCTFHRAIESVGDVRAGMEGVVACGFASVLTGGGEAGVEGVKEVQERFGGRVSVVLGGGVRRGNVRALREGAGVAWVHSAAITGEGEEVDGEEVRALVVLVGES